MVGAGGSQLGHQVSDGRLSVELPPDQTELTVSYALPATQRSGLDTRTGTATWPDSCGDLFPCSTDPSEGQRFELTLTGVPEGQQAIYPRRLDCDVPASTLAWAVGDYRYQRF